MAEILNFNNGKHIPVYTNGRYKIVNDEERIDIYDKTIPDMSFEVSSGDTWIIFRGYKIEFSNTGEYIREKHLCSIEIEIEQWDIIILDTDAEIFITKNWDVYHIPFRFLLQNCITNDLCNNIEFCGHYAPSIEERIIGLTEIRGKLYEIN